MKNITIIGAGYVGLVTGASFAKLGNVVTMVEKDTQKITALINGKVPFYEPGLDELVATGLKNKTLRFTTDIAEACSNNPELIFSCVGTPAQDNGQADLSYVWQAMIEIGQTISQYALIINKSTVPIGTTQRVKNIIQEQLLQRKVTLSFDVASNPEFLREGNALNDFLYPDRIVIGTQSPKAQQLLTQLYTPLISAKEQLIIMDETSAEMTKYAANAMLATRISFMNQLAQLADKVGADIDMVKTGMAKDKRIGSSFLNAGIGFGGSCFPKDIKALIHMGIEHDSPMTLIQEVDAINQEQRKTFIRSINTYYQQKLRNKKIGIWGLSFKPETDDIRYAPSLDVINFLLEQEAQVFVYDPVAINAVKKIYKNSISYSASPIEVLHQADALVILTEWAEFTAINPQLFLRLSDKTVFDGRNCFDPAILKNIGITYLCIGRNNYSPATPTPLYEQTMTVTNTIIL